jgi:hypothetical protein
VAEGDNVVEGRGRSDDDAVRKGSDDDFGPYTKEGDTGLEMEEGRHTDTPDVCLSNRRPARRSMFFYSLVLVYDRMHYCGGLFFQQK